MQYLALPACLVSWRQPHSRCKQARTGHPTDFQERVDFVVEPVNLKVKKFKGTCIFFNAETKIDIKALTA